VKDPRVFTIPKDGIYILDLQISSHDEFNASINIKFQGENGFLTAKDLPMLHVNSTVKVSSISIVISVLTFSSMPLCAVTMQYWRLSGLFSLPSTGIRF
jgi:hypothetical protein